MTSGDFVSASRLAGDSSEHRDAESVMLQLLGERLEATLRKERFPLPEGGWIEVDGVSHSPPILCEAWAHQGPAKAAQKNKVMADAMKLLYAAQLLPRPRLILLFADEAAALHLRGRSWMGKVLKGNGIAIEVVTLPEDIRTAVRAAQTRQFR